MERQTYTFLLTYGPAGLRHGIQQVDVEAESYYAARNRIFKDLDDQDLTDELVECHFAGINVEKVADIGRDPVGCPDCGQLYGPAAIGSRCTITKSCNGRIIRTNGGKVKASAEAALERRSR